MAGLHQPDLRKPTKEYMGSRLNAGSNLRVVLDYSNER